MAIHGNKRRRESTTPPAKRRRMNNGAAEATNDEVKDATPIARQDTGSTVVGDLSTQELEHHFGHTIDPNIPAETLAALKEIVQEEMRERAARTREFAALEKACADADTGRGSEASQTSSSSSESSEDTANSEPIPPKPILVNPIPVNPIPVNPIPPKPMPPKPMPLKHRPLPTEIRSSSTFLETLCEYMPLENATSCSWTSYLEYKKAHLQWLLPRWQTCAQKAEEMEEHLTPVKSTQWKQSQALEKMGEELRRLKQAESDMRDLHRSVASPLADGVYELVCRAQERHEEYIKEYKTETEKHDKPTEDIQRMQNGWARMASLAWYAETELVNIGRDIQALNAQLHPPATRVVPETKSTDAKPQESKAPSRGEAGPSSSSA